MNPMTNVRNITKLSDRELKQGDGKTSWHDEYRDSAWLFIGGLPYDLTEGDVIAIFSQYGEIVNINLIRDKTTGKSKGFAFLCYENQRSTILAVDNFNGIKILGRTLRVDHVKEYKVPKDNDKAEDLTRALWKDGCAPGSMFGGSALEQNKGNQELLESEEDDYLLPPPPKPSLPSSSSKRSASTSTPPDKEKERERSRPEKRKHKESKKSKKAFSKKSKKSDKKKKSKSKKHHKKHSRKSSSSSDSDDDRSDSGSDSS